MVNWGLNLLLTLTTLARLSEPSINWGWTLAHKILRFQHKRVCPPNSHPDPRTCKLWELQATPLGKPLPESLACRDSATSQSCQSPCLPLPSRRWPTTLCGPYSSMCHGLRSLSCPLLRGQVAGCQALSVTENNPSSLLANIWLPLCLAPQPSHDLGQVYTCPGSELT